NTPVCITSVSARKSATVHFFLFIIVSFERSDTSPLCGINCPIFRKLNALHFSYRMGLRASTLLCQQMLATTFEETAIFFIDKRKCYIPVEEKSQVLRKNSGTFYQDVTFGREVSYD